MTAMGSNHLHPKGRNMLHIIGRRSHRWLKRALDLFGESSQSLRH